MLYISNLIRWLQRKRYQYEVTFSLYMLTPTEKFIFSTFCFHITIHINLLTYIFTDTCALLFFSMVILAASLYLPGHIKEMFSRAWFYYAGDETVAATAGAARGAAAGQGAGAGAGFAETRQRKAGGSGGRMDKQDVLDMLGTL